MFSLIGHYPIWTTKSRDTRELDRTNLQWVQEAPLALPVTLKVITAAREATTALAHTTTAEGLVKVQVNRVK